MIVAYKNLENIKVLPQVKFESLEINGIVANFYYPSGKKNLPAILIVSGSEGGISTPDIIAGILASKGYAALALAYFEMPRLPDILEEITLDYIEKAINWVYNHEVVNQEKIAMMGTSKGAELVLLSASIFPQIRCVIAASPSCAIFQSINPDPNAPPKSSWIYRGKPLTFVPFIYTEAFYKQFSSGYPKHLEFLPLYEASLSDKEKVKKAVIKVENIQGPLLLISSDDDRVWPSKKMSKKIVERLKNHEFPFKCQHLSYDGAGHMAARPGYMPWPTPFYVKGGSPKRNGQVQADSWKAVLKFLDDNLLNNKRQNRSLHP